MINNEVTTNVIFTKEGYDLITNKFLYTNNELERTVHLKIIKKNNRLYYEKNNDINSLSNLYFYNINELDARYFFTKTQLNKLNTDDFIKYVSNNVNKINKIALYDKNFAHTLQYINKPEEKIIHLKDYLFNNGDIYNNTIVKAK